MSQDALGLLLVQEGVISQPQLYEALYLQRHNGRSLSTCLLGLGHIKPEALLAYQSRILDVPALPPGSLVRAAPEAVMRVPAELAFRLRIVPFSWDGQVLGVALSDPAVIASLTEVAYHAQAAVGAYIALEGEIESVLPVLYRTEMPPAPIVQPPAVTETTAPGAYRPSPPPVPSRSMPLERLSVYDATASIYEARTVEEIGHCIGRALLNYFARVIVLKLEGEHAKLASYAGSVPIRTIVALSAVPYLLRGLDGPRFVYGLAAADARSRELTDALGIDPAATSLIYTVAYQSTALLLLHADNAQGAELYEDLHDIQMLLKEADTAVNMLYANAGA